MGTMTATFGGLIRDVVCTETPLLLKREIYATAAAAGAALLVAGEALGLSVQLATGLGLRLPSPFAPWPWATASPCRSTGRAMPAHGKRR